METQIFTYEELAKHLNITKKSAQNLVRKKGWQRTLGNDRKTRIHVPQEAHQEEHIEDHTESTSSLTEGASEVPALRAKIEGLERALEAEKMRADAAELDRDRWHSFATRKRSWLDLFK